MARSAGFMEANSLTNSQELAELELGGGSPPDAKSVKPAGGHARLHCRPCEAPHQALLLLRGMSWAGQVFTLQLLRMSLTCRRQQHLHSEAVAVLRDLETCGLLLHFAACCRRARLLAMLVAY